MARVIQVVEARVGRRVAPGIERCRDLGDAHRSCGKEAVDDRRLAHPGLADEHARLAFQVGHQGTEVAPGGQRHQAVAEPPVGLERGKRRRRLRQVHLVEHDERRHPAVLGRRQAPVHEVFAERGHRRDHDGDLRDVGGDELLARAVGAVEKSRTRVHRLDHAPAGGGARDRHAVTARERAALSPRDAVEARPIGELDQVAAPEARHDLAFQQMP